MEQMKKQPTTNVHVETFFKFLFRVLRLPRFLGVARRSRATRNSSSRLGLGNGQHFVIEDSQREQERKKIHSCDDKTVDQKGQQYLRDHYDYLECLKK